MAEATRATGGVQSSGLGLDALFGGLIAAVLVFLLTVLYTEVREARQRSTERSGLARVLDAEIAQNSHVLHVLNPFDVIRPDGEGGRAIGLTREAWLECRARMAQLADREAFNALEVYYRELGQLMEVDPASSSIQAHIARAAMETENRIQNLKGLQTLASNAMQRYVEPSEREKLLGF